MNRENGEVFRLRWQGLCCVPSCSAMASIHKHPFRWREMCSRSTKIASIDCDSVERKHLVLTIIG